MLDVLCTKRNFKQFAEYIQKYICMDIFIQISPIFVSKTDYNSAVVQATSHHMKMQDTSIYWIAPQFWTSNESTNTVEWQSSLSQFILFWFVLSEL